MVKKITTTRWFKMTLIAMLGWGMVNHFSLPLRAQEGTYPGLMRFLQLRPKSENSPPQQADAPSIPPQQLAPPLPEQSPFPLPGTPQGSVPQQIPNYQPQNIPQYSQPNPVPAYNTMYAPMPLPPGQFANSSSTPIATYSIPQGSVEVGQAVATQPIPVGPSAFPAQTPSSSNIVGASYQENTEQQVLEAIQAPTVVAPPAPPSPPSTPPATASILENNLPAPSNARPLVLSEPYEGQRIISTYADPEMYEEETEEDVEEVEAVPVDSNEITSEEGAYMQLEGEDYYQLGLLGQACHSGAIWCSRAGIIGGVQGTFLAPTKDSMLSVEMLDIVDNNRTIEESDFGFGGGVRTWLGIQSENVGFRAVYWGYDNNHYQPDEDVNGIGSAGFSNNYFLGANTLDIEMFNNYCFGLSTVRASLGARYADMERQAMILGRGKVGDVGLLGIASSQANLEGWGVVAGLEGNVPLRPWFRDPNCGPGPCNFFWKVQGSGLAAETKAVAVTQVHVVPTSELFATAYSRDEAFAGSDATLLNGMLQLGLNYRIPLSRCARPAFIDLLWAFEAQTWQTGEAAARSKSNAFLAGLYEGREFGGAVEAKSDTNPSDIGLYGFVFGASLNY